jgi:hypothetical protein
MKNLTFLDEYDNTVYETTETGTILSSFSAPGINPKLAFDGTHLWKIENQKEAKKFSVLIIELVNNLLVTINSIILPLKKLFE